MLNPPGTFGIFLSIDRLSVWLSVEGPVTGSSEGRVRFEPNLCEDLSRCITVSIGNFQLYPQVSTQWEAQKITAAAVQLRDKAQRGR